MSFLIYEAVNLANGKRYIGKTQDFEFRKYQHQQNALNGIDKIFYRAIRKYGFDTFQWNILSTHRVEARALEAEVNCIKKCRVEGITLYNMTEGGEGTSGRKYSKATRAKISAALKGRKWDADVVAKRSETVRNSGKRKLINVTSQYKGVTHMPPSWWARYGNKSLGYFRTEEEAAKAFDYHSHKHGGYRNFPSEEPQIPVPLTKVETEARRHQSIRNAPKMKKMGKVPTTSQYKGVSREKRNKNIWYAKAWRHNKKIHIGTFPSELEAHEAYENFVK